MTKTLNIDAFNKTFLGALKDESDMEGLLLHEIEVAYAVKIKNMECLVKCLNEGLPYHEILNLINNIDSKCDCLMKKLEAVRGEQE